MLNNVIETIQKYNMIEKGDKIVLGVSGGPDSVCLFQILTKLRYKLDIQLYAVHINHCIRGEEAIKDEKYVIELAEKLDIPCFVRRIDVKEYAKNNKITLEEAGRKVRYDAFYEVLSEVKANKIAVGHNLNDRVETFLFNLMRGSGPNGLKSIEPINGNIIRPLIEMPRKEIEKYCNDNKLETHIDLTNLENDYTRNKIRNLLIPYIKENFNQNIETAIIRTTNILNLENEYLEKIAKEKLNECMKNKDKLVLDINKFNELDFVIKARVIRQIIQKLNGTTKNIEKKHIEKIIELAKNKKTNTKIELPEKTIIEISYNDLIFKNRITKKVNEYLYKLKIGINEITELGIKINLKKANFDESYLKNKNLCVLDYEKITNNIDKLVLRNRRTGDIFTPLGMKGSKKLKDYFIDEKTPINMRNEIPLLAIDTQIIWIIGDRISENYIKKGKQGEVIICEIVKDIL